MTPESDESFLDEAPTETPRNLSNSVNRERRSRARRKIGVDSVGQCSHCQTKTWTKKTLNNDVQRYRRSTNNSSFKGVTVPSSELQAVNSRHSVKKSLNASSGERQDKEIRDLDRLKGVKFQREGVGSGLGHAEENTVSISCTGERVDKIVQVSQSNKSEFEVDDEGTRWLKLSGETTKSISNRMIDKAEVETAVVCNACYDTKIDNKTKKDESENDTSYDNKQNKSYSSPITCGTELEVRDSQAKQVFYEGKDCNDDCEICNSGIESREKGIPYSKDIVKSGNVLCCAATKQEETDDSEACNHKDTVLNSVSMEFDDRGAYSCEPVTCFGRVKAAETSACSAETCLSAICLPCHAIPQYDDKLIFQWTAINTIDLTVAEAALCVVKHHRNKPIQCKEYVVPEQESQIGYESHLNGGVMVNGHTLVYYNVSMMLMGSLRGDKTNRSHDYSGFGSLRNNSGLEQFRDTCNETTFASFRENRQFNYAQSSYRAEIVGASNLAGVYSESDVTHKPLDHKQTLHIMNDGLTQDQKPVTGHASAVLPETTDALALKPKHDVTKSFGYNKPTYPVLIGNYVKVYLTKLFAILPHHSKFMVKERLPTTSGITRAKLTLKSSSPLESHDFVNEELNHRSKAEDYGKSVHFRENCRNPGYVIYTCDGNFSGTIQYPLPSSKATDSKIGKGGNGFVFTIYHQRKKYAAKKTVYRANEVNVHAALRHENILPLVAVLMGERHEHHKSKFYCFHFMPVMDCDLRQILSAREVGCLKHFYTNCSKEPGRWEAGFNNIKFILGETLKALIYLHDNGYVHRDVKASNIMIKMQCRCQPLSCRCSSKFQVKLGDFDSAGTVPGLGIKEPTDQMIKFASILPLGTPGYRAPEVSMHITLSGPYETLYTFAVDMWSFGCLCLNICIGKTAALRQREEASLLLSRTHPCSTELWEKTTKIKELERAKPFIYEKAMINLIRSCLQVNSGERPSARDALKVFKPG